MDHPESGVRIEFGDQTILVPQMVFYTIRMAWPSVQRLLKAVGIVEEADASLDIVVAALSNPERDGPPELRGDALQRQLQLALRGDQMAELVRATIKLLGESGLIPKGEKAAPDTAAVGAENSTETAPPSSPSSSVTA